MISSLWKMLSDSAATIRRRTSAPPCGMTMSSPSCLCSTYVIEFASAMTGTAESANVVFRSSHGFARVAASEAAEL